MADFKTFADRVNAQFNAMSEHELFVSDKDGDTLYQIYLDAFPKGTNEIFRERTEHDCSCCKNFIRNIGNVILIHPDTLTVSTIWDTAVDLPSPYGVVASRMRAVILDQLVVSNLFRANERKYGTEYNHDIATGRRWDHFWVEIADRHYAPGKVDKICGQFRTDRDVIVRTYMEGHREALDTVMELIASDNLYRGAQYLHPVKTTRDFHLKIDKLPDMGKVLKAVSVAAASREGSTLASFRNSAIGSLVLDLTSGTDLEAAVGKFEAKVAGDNYRRPKSLITPAMINRALEKLKELGLSEAVNRRAARLSDISVNNVIWAASAARLTMKDHVDALRDNLMGAAAKPDIPEVPAGTEATINAFLQLVQDAKDVSIILKSDQLKNLVTLTTSDDPAQLFNWNNQFGWSYSGDVADSIVQRVKAAGGKTDGVLRVSLAWDNIDDLDLHCQTPKGRLIYYGARSDGRNNRVLDVDANAPGTIHTTEPVENMNFPYLEDGTYKFHVNMYTSRSSANKGYAIEIATPNEIWNLTGKVFSGDTGQIQISVKNGQVVSVQPPSEMQSGRARSRDMWGISSNVEVPVDAIMLSPNYWDEQKGKGLKHFFFMLRGCQNPEPVRGIYNEFLRPDLNEHRKVFEVIGERTKAAPDAQGMSGVGFSANSREKVTFRITHKNGRKSQYVVHI